MLFQLLNCGCFIEQWPNLVNILCVWKLSIWSKGGGWIQSFTVCNKTFKLCVLVKHHLLAPIGFMFEEQFPTRVCIHHVRIDYGVINSNLVAACCVLC